MKRLIALALLCALSGCAQNTPQIMAELNSHE